MQPHEGRWSDLAVGTYMRDREGKTWKVVAERDFHLQIQDRDGVKKHLAPRSANTPVTIMGATEAEAIGTLREKLDARAVARRAAGETDWLVPAFPKAGQSGAIADARSHLMMVHGIWTGDVKRMDGDNGMLACHLDSHLIPDKNYQAHTHPGGNPS